MSSSFPTVLLIWSSLDLLNTLVSHRPNIVYVASNHFVWRLVPVSISSQIEQLLQDKQFELALQLAVSHHQTSFLHSFSFVWCIS